MPLKKSQKMEVQLLKSDIVLPEEVGNAFAKAGHKRVLLRASSKNLMVETHVALRKIQGNYRVYFGKQHQKQLGLSPLDTFCVQLIEDTSKYGVVPPASFIAVLESDPAGASVFESLTDGKKRGVIYHIKRYKSEQMQIDKTLILLENLKRGLRDFRELFKT